MLARAAPAAAGAAGGGAATARVRHGADQMPPVSCEQCVSELFLGPASESLATSEACHPAPTPHSGAEHKHQGVPTPCLTAVTTCSLGRALKPRLTGLVPGVCLWLDRTQPMASGLVPGHLPEASLARPCPPARSLTPHCNLQAAAFHTFTSLSQTCVAT